MLETATVVAGSAPAPRRTRGPRHPFSGRSGRMTRSHFVRALTAVALSATAAQAQLAGTINFSGTVRARAATLPGGGLDPVNVVLDFVAPVSSGFGYVTISAAGNTGSFAALNSAPPASPYFGTLKDLTVGLGGAYNVPSMLLTPFPVNTYSFDLQSIVAGTFTAAACSAPAAAGQTCTPVDGSGSKTVLSLANTLNSNGSIDATLSFNVAGVVSGPAGQSSPFAGTFTTHFPGQTYQQVLAQIGTPGGTLDRSFSATLVATAVPEPATVTLMGAGLLSLAGMGWARRRRDA
jgi:hypothetical protein